MLPGGGALRALGRVGLHLRAAHAPRTCNTAQQAGGRSGAIRHMCSASLGALASGAGARLGSLGSGLVLGTGGMLAYQVTANATATDIPQGESISATIPWVKDLAEQPGVEEMLSPGQMLRQHPIAKVFLDQDHLFETMAASAQIKEFRCFYDRSAKRFHSVVQLGKDVCGFPQTVHGGLTAAIIDETFGGLGVCMWRSGALGVRPPAYTARLEVDYQKKIPAGSTLLVSTELERVEGRKIWMRATVSNGKGTSYASARALFVAPRLPGEGIAQSIKGWLPWGNKRTAAGSASPSPAPPTISESASKQQHR